jgi:hypothetical protein
MLCDYQYHITSVLRLSLSNIYIYIYTHTHTHTSNFTYLIVVCAPMVKKSDFFLWQGNKSNLILHDVHIKFCELGSSVSIVSGYGLDGRSSIPDGDRIFPLVCASRLALGPTEPPIQFLYNGHRGRGLFP